MTFACNGCQSWIEAPERPKKCPFCGSRRVVVPSPGELK
jgi:DNA-directed RNA polymerase subunit RPC12/RpoP